MSTKRAGQMLVAVALVGLVQQLVPFVCGQLLQAEPQGSGTAVAAGSTGEIVSSSAAPLAADSLASQRFENFKLSHLFTPPFDPKILALPESQLALVRAKVARNVAFFNEIIAEALEKRNKFAASVKLMLKYTGKLLGRFIRDRRDEMALAERLDPAPEFHVMLADLVGSVLDRSSVLKRERAYSKDSVDAEAFRARAMALFDYLQRIINISPLGGYLKWNEARLYTDQPQSPLFNISLAEEAADLNAQFRALGYESFSFVARRIVNLLRMFARGITPGSEEEV